MNWLAARNGFPSDASAVDESGQINQFLTTHASTEIYQGSVVVDPIPWNYFPNFIWGKDTTQYAQGIALPGGTTTIGRVGIPWEPVGNACDLTVSLYTDSSGVPGTKVVSTRVPAAWLRALAPTTGVSLGTARSNRSLTGSALALAQNTILLPGPWQTINWSSPLASGSTVASNPSSCVSGNYIIQVGGTTGGVPAAAVFTIAYSGGTTLDNAVPQPALPITNYGAAVATTPDTLIAAGGLTSSSLTPTAAVFTAGWDPNTGVVQAWSSQTNLPQALYGANAASFGETVYVVGGIDAAGTAAINTVYIGTVQNGQIQSWSLAQPLPVAIYVPAVAVVGNFLIIAGGLTTSGGLTPATNVVVYAVIHADGSLGPWQSAPAMPTGVGMVRQNVMVTNNAIIVSGGTTDGSTDISTVQSLMFTSDGPGTWRTSPNGNGGETAIFPTGPGLWQAFNVSATNYQTATFYWTPAISVPLPATGLTSGGNYHIVMEMVNPTVNNYVQCGICLGSLGSMHSAPAGSSSWSSFEAGFIMPITVYDLSSAGLPWHTWGDGGARISTLVNTTTPDQRLLGIADSTQFVDGTVDASVVTVEYAASPTAFAPANLTQL